MSSLAATQSDGFYFPPSYDGRTMGGLSKFNTNGQYKGANQYLQNGVVRFELPFDGWCVKCESHKSKGLRFNARKDRAGKYHSTQIWSFSMKCDRCDQIFVIKTDPANDTYDFAEGIRKHEQDFEPELDDSIIRATTDEERHLLSTNPMYRLQHEKEDKTRAATAKEQLESLINLRDAHASQDYDMNCLMRKGNRDKKKRDQLLIQEGEARGLNIAMVEEDESDRKRAKQAHFRSSSSAQHGQHGGFAMSERKKNVQLQNQSIFAAPALTSSRRNTTARMTNNMDTSRNMAATVASSSEVRKQEKVRSAMLKQAEVRINTANLRLHSEPKHVFVAVAKITGVAATAAEMSERSGGNSSKALAMLSAYSDD